MPTCKFSLRLISLVLKEFIETIREQFKKKIFSFSGNFIYSHNPFFWWFIGIVTRKIYVGHFCWPKMKWLSIPRVPKNIYQFATVIYWVIHNRESFMPQTDNKTKVLWKGINKDYSLWRSLTWIIFENQLLLAKIYQLSPMIFIPDVFEKRPRKFSRKAMS